MWSVFVLTALAIVQSVTPHESAPAQGDPLMELTSPAFQHEDMIPPRYTCDGEDISPELRWTGAPEGTKSFVLISDDPDAPVGLWVHWVIYEIPPTATGLPEAVDPSRDSLPNGARQGVNSWSRIGYGGPCPPGGTHRYFFKLYALDCNLLLQSGATKSEVEKGIKEHILAEAVLMGRYSRKR